MATFFSQYNYATEFQHRDMLKIVDATTKERVLLLMMERMGRITGPAGGDFCEWPVWMRNPKPRGFSPSATPEYNSPDPFRVAALNWGSYQHGLILDRITLQVNKGKEQLINKYEHAKLEVESSFKNRWPEYLYQDGSNPPGGEPYPIHGFYTWLGQSIASTAAANQGYQGKCRLVSGSFAGLVMDLGTEGTDYTGSDGFTTVQTTNAGTGVTAGQKWWPAGKGDPAYDYWHPLIVNSTANGWGTNPGFNERYASDILDWAIGYSRRVASGDAGEVNLVLCATDPMLTIQKHYHSTYRTMAQYLNDPMGQPTQGRAYQTAIYNHAGCALVKDYDIPNTTDLIGINMDTIQYKTVHPINQYSGTLPIMEPWNGQVPGGNGELLGGWTLGQMYPNSPRNTFLITPLGDA